MPLAEHPAVAPLAEGSQDRDEVLPFEGELVLVAAPVHAGGDAGQDPVLDEVIEALRQDVLGDVQVRLEVGEAPRAGEGLAHHQEGPPVAHDLERPGYRAVLVAKTVTHRKRVA